MCGLPSSGNCGSLLKVYSQCSDRGEWTKQKWGTEAYDKAPRHIPEEALSELKFEKFIEARQAEEVRESKVQESREWAGLIGEAVSLLIPV